MFQDFLISIFGEELYNVLVLQNPELVSTFIFIMFFMLLILIFNLVKTIFGFGGKI